MPRSRSVKTAAPSLATALPDGKLSIKEVEHRPATVITNPLSPHVQSQSLEKKISQLIETEPADLGFYNYQPAKAEPTTAFQMSRSLPPTPLQASPTITYQQLLPPVQHQPPQPQPVLYQPAHFQPPQPPQPPQPIQFQPQPVQAQPASFQYQSQPPVQFQQTMPLMAKQYQ